MIPYRIAWRSARGGAAGPLRTTWALERPAGGLDLNRVITGAVYGHVRTSSSANPGKATSAINAISTLNSNEPILSCQG